MPHKGIVACIINCTICIKLVLFNSLIYIEINPLEVLEMRDKQEKKVCGVKNLNRFLYI